MEKTSWEGIVHHGSSHHKQPSFEQRAVAEKGLYFTADTRYARFYSDTDLNNGGILTAKVRLTNPYHIQLPENHSFRGSIIFGNRMIAASYRKLTKENILELQSQGYDGVLVTVNGPLPQGDWKDDPTNPFEVVVFDLSQIEILHYLKNTSKKPILESQLSTG